MSRQIKRQIDWENGDMSDGLFIAYSVAAIISLALFFGILIWWLVAVS